MSRLFLPNSVGASCALLAVCDSPLLALRAGARVKPRLSEKRKVFDQQRRYVGGSHTASKHRSRSGVWVCGLGVGLALAVGLKHRTDTSSSCDAEVEITDRYSAAIRVSRDLVDGIKVGSEVGRSPLGPLPLVPKIHLSAVCVLTGWSGGSGFGGRGLCGWSSGVEWRLVPVRCTGKLSCSLNQHK